MVAWRLAYRYENGQGPPFMPLQAACLRGLVYCQAPADRRELAMLTHIQKLLAFIGVRRPAPSGASLEVRMEHFFIAVRWCGIGLLAPVLPLTGLALHQI